MKNDQGQAYAAFSSDAGRTWGMPIRLDDGGSLGRVDVELLDDGSAVASWVEYAEGRSDFRIRRDRAIGREVGARSPSPPSQAARRAATRALRRVDNELIFAWTDSAADASGALQLQTRPSHQLP